MLDGWVEANLKEHYGFYNICICSIMYCNIHMPTISIMSNYLFLVISNLTCSYVIVNHMSSL
jgi:hypothetical protein